MKRVLPIVIAVVVVGAAAAAYILTKKGTTLVTSTPSAATESKSGSGDFRVVDACEAVTQADAGAILGATAKKGDTSIGDSSNEDINVSTCSYTIPSPLKSLTLKVQSARTSIGADRNRAHFTTGLPAAAQKVSGYGDAAYWDPTYGQLNILKHNNWYILSNGGLRPTDKTLDEGKAFADRIIAKL